jgi:hypothetical protein
MDVLDALKHAMDESGTGGRELSRKLGKSESYVGVTIAKGSDVQASNLAKMANLMGWQLMLRKGDAEIEISPRC